MSSSKIIIVIPARYASSRFPGKPLALIHGKTMIERVYQRCLQCKQVKKIIVATDDSRIFDHVRGFGGLAYMTSPSHRSGTDRCGEIIKKYEGDADILINVQGDEPYISPKQIELLISCFAEEDCKIATLVRPLDGAEELQNSNVVKVVLDRNGFALYFSRLPIPYSPAQNLKNHSYLQHVGIYGYRTQTLNELIALEQSPLEIAENLEQLRWLENGYRIKTALTKEESFSVDVPEDLARLELQFKP